MEDPESCAGGMEIPEQGNRHRESRNGIRSPHRWRQSHIYLEQQPHEAGTLQVLGPGREWRRQRRSRSDDPEQLIQANAAETESPMEKRKLGNTGFDVAPLAFGGNVFGWTVDEPTSFLLLDTFVDAGFNLIDTADSYSRWVPGHAGGESETIIGRWIAKRGRHDDVVIATKIGSDMGLGYKCLRREYIMQGAEQSLKRLQVDAIDLYQSHWDDEATPLDETLEAYARLLKEGKVKAIGASNLTADRLGHALEVSRKQGLP